jgi:hypothetical protein
MTLTQLKELAEKAKLENSEHILPPEIVLDLITRVERLSEVLYEIAGNGTGYGDMATEALAQYGADKELG